MFVGSDASIGEIFRCCGGHKIRESRLQCCEFIIAELSEHSGRYDKRFRRRIADCGRIAAPLPLLGTRNQTGSNRIHCDVAAQREEIVLPLHNLLLEPALKHMTDSVMSAVPPLGV